MSKSDKRDNKRRILANSAAEALCKLGYAKTSMRDIAEISGDPLSTLHYYFEDRIDLITFSVRTHKLAFLEKMESALDANTLEDLITGFSAGLAEAATNDGERHNLWFDIRNQAAFTPTLQPAIYEIEAALIAIFRKIEARFMPDRSDALLDYIAVDGLFRHIVQSSDPAFQSYDANRKLFERKLRILWPNH